MEAFAPPRFWPGLLVSLPLACLIRVSVAAILAFSVQDQACADELTGRLLTVVDGDRVDIAAGNTAETVRLRLRGVDAPEQGQPHWQEAKMFLNDLLAGKNLTVTVGQALLQEPDGRSMGKIVLPDGRTANRSLVTAGLAWVYEEDLHDAQSEKNELKVLELEARKAGRGLWADRDPVPPWLYRRLRSGAYP